MRIVARSHAGPSGGVTAGTGGATRSFSEMPDTSLRGSPGTSGLALQAWRGPIAAILDVALPGFAFRSSSPGSDSEMGVSRSILAGFCLTESMASAASTRCPLVHL